MADNLDNLEKLAIDWYNAKIEFISHSRYANHKEVYMQAEQKLSAKVAAILTAKEFGLKRKYSKR